MYNITIHQNCKKTLKGILLAKMKLDGNWNSHLLTEFICIFIKKISMFLI